MRQVNLTYKIESLSDTVKTASVIGKTKRMSFGAINIAAPHYMHFPNRIGKYSPLSPESDSRTLSLYIVTIVSLSSISLRRTVFTMSLLKPFDNSASAADCESVHASNSGEPSQSKPAKKNYCDLETVQVNDPDSKPNLSTILRTHGALVDEQGASHKHAKLLARKERNRASAQRSRLRKKEERKKVTNNFSSLTQENEYLRKRIENFTLHVLPTLRKAAANIRESERRENQMRLVEKDQVHFLDINHAPTLFNGTADATVQEDQFLLSGLKDKTNLSGAIGKNDDELTASWPPL